MSLEEFLLHAKEIFKYLGFLSIPFTMINVYLTLNKLWNRRHQKAVAESISITGRIIAIVGVLVFIVNFILNGVWLSLINMFVLLILETVQILIGAGVWVDSGKKRSFWDLIKQSLQLERKESADLAKFLFKPTNAEEIIVILKQVAMIDGVLDDREKKFVRSFADNWKIKLSWDNFSSKTAEDVNYNALRQSMMRYLETTPPPEQASQLGDLLNLLVKADNEVSEDEELILEELMGLINNYVDRGSERIQYSVAILPQNTEQEESIRNISDVGQKNKISGGYAYILGPFYSVKYAEIMCEKYRQQNLMVLAVQGNIQSGNYKFINTNGKKKVATV